VCESVSQNVKEHFSFAQLQNSS